MDSASRKYQSEPRKSVTNLTKTLKGDDSNYGKMSMVLLKELNRLLHISKWLLNFPFAVTHRWVTYRLRLGCIFFLLTNMEEGRKQQEKNPRLTVPLFILWYARGGPFPGRSRTKTLSRHTWRRYLNSGPQLCNEHPQWLNRKDFQVSHY